MRITDLPELKRERRPIVMVTAYDFPTAEIVDDAGVDLVLVGDSAANVVLGHRSTVPVEVDELLVLVKAVRRGLRGALLVADLPFGSYEISDEQAVTTAVRFVKEGGADAVKLERGGTSVARATAVIAAGIPVMGHLGLTPQTAVALGGLRAQGRQAGRAAAITRDALALQAAGCFSVVLEAVPAAVAARTAELLDIPVIGIGAGGAVDGQVLVVHDLVGLTPDPAPTFVRRYADARTVIGEAVREYATDVRVGNFPSSANTYPIAEDELAAYHHLIADLDTRS